MVLVLLDLIEKNGFTPSQGNHSAFNGSAGLRQRQPVSEEAKPEEKPTEAAKSYSSEQVEAVRRYE